MKSSERRAKWRRGARLTMSVPEGSLNKRTTNFQADIAESGLTPMRYLQGVMCDEKADPDRRDRAAIAMMPYLVPRLAVVDVNAKVKTEDTSQLNDEERRAKARAMILEAFAERPQPAIEGRFKVIAGGNVAAADEPQSVGQGMGRGKHQTLTHWKRAKNSRNMAEGFRQTVHDAPSTECSGSSR